MRQKLTASQWTILVLGAGLMISLIANVYLLQQRNAPLPHLRGTYCTDASTGLGTYLIFDGESRFCRYTQTEGVLDDGTCEDLGEGRYALRSDGWQGFAVLRDREGVHLFDGADSSAAFFERMGEFYAMPQIPGGYPDWLKPPRK